MEAAYKRLRDRVGETAIPSGGALGLDAFQGVWINTDRDSNWISRIELNIREGVLSVLPQEPDGSQDGAESQAESVYGASLDSCQAIAFRVFFERPTARLQLQGNLNLGLLVLAGLRISLDDAMPDLFLREFFYRGGSTAERG